MTYYQIVGSTTSAQSTTVTNYCTVGGGSWNASNGYVRNRVMSELTISGLVLCASTSATKASKDD